MLTPQQPQGRRAPSKSLALRQGSKRANPDKLTPVSDSGEQAPLTPQQRQGRRGISNAAATRHHSAP
ncbi:hypothetical protein CV016_00350 [Yersinia kristensenii]|nr:hypothetical protein CV016_00350 [Yersinia kristensenii]